VFDGEFAGKKVSVIDIPATDVESVDELPEAPKFLYSPAENVVFNLELAVPEELRAA